MNELFMKLVSLLGILGSSRVSTRKSYPNWMAQIPDEHPLSALSIPGTHNSLSLYGGVMKRCQFLNLDQQLNGGTRYTDITVQESKGIFYVSYYNQPQEETLLTVIKVVKTFLNTNPSETILMRLKQLKRRWALTKNFYEKMFNILDHTMGPDSVWKKTYLPTLGEARGKLIVLRVNHEVPIGVPYYSLDIADDHQVTSLYYVMWKWNKIEKHIKKAMSGDINDMFLTYTSGYGRGTNPGMISYYINPWLKDYLRKVTQKNNRLGIIAMDYTNTELMELIIAFRPEKLGFKKLSFKKY